MYHLSHNKIDSSDILAVTYSGVKFLLLNLSLIVVTVVLVSFLHFFWSKTHAAEMSKLIGSELLWQWCNTMYTPRKINILNLKIPQLKRKIILQTIIFRFYVNLPGCNTMYTWQWTARISAPVLGRRGEFPRWLNSWPEKRLRSGAWFGWYRWCVSALRIWGSFVGMR